MTKKLAQPRWHSYVREIFRQHDIQSPRLPRPNLRAGITLYGRCRGRLFGIPGRIAFPYRRDGWISIPRWQFVLLQLFQTPHRAGKVGCPHSAKDGKASLPIQASIHRCAGAQFQCLSVPCRSLLFLSVADLAVTAQALRKIRNARKGKSVLRIFHAYTNARAKAVSMVATALPDAS